MRMLEVERRFNLTKRKCGIGRMVRMVIGKLRENASHVIAMSILVLNLRKVWYVLLQVFPALLRIFMLQRKLVFVQ